MSIKHFGWTFLIYKKNKLFDVCDLEITLFEIRPLIMEIISVPGEPVFVESNPGYRCSTFPCWRHFFLGMLFQNSCWRTRRCQSLLVFFENESVIDGEFFKNLRVEKLGKIRNFPPNDLKVLEWTRRQVALKARQLDVRSVTCCCTSGKPQTLVLKNASRGVADSIIRTTFEMSPIFSRLYVFSYVFWNALIRWDPCFELLAFCTV